MESALNDEGSGVKRDDEGSTRSQTKSMILQDSKLGCFLWCASPKQLSTKAKEVFLEEFNALRIADITLDNLEKLAWS
ncbi:hypothetical protein Ae201684P_019796 [Aphanomyces euteiches]|nr:hypothetical protein Ae201684P_019796 [Aphanomyces euteiches]